MLRGLARATRRLAAAAVYVSVAYLAAGLGYAVLLRDPILHPYLAGLGALTVFVTGVAVAYTAAAKPRTWPGTVLLVAGLAASMTAPLAAVASPVYGLVALSYALAAVGLGVLDTGARLPRGTTTRWSLLGLAYTYLYTSTYTVFSAALPYPSLYHQLLGYILALPVQAIYAVTLHSLPSTYRERPGRLIILAFPLASLASLLLPLQPLAGAAAGIASLAVFLATAGFTRIPSALAKPLRGEAGRAHRYFLVGHIYAALAAVAAAVFMASYAAGYISLLGLVHYLLLGFTMTFIAIHAPLMLPVILGTSTARRYHYAGFPLLIASGLVWQYSPRLSLVLLAAGLLATLIVVKPAGRRRRGSRG